MKYISRHWDKKTWNQFHEYNITWYVFHVNKKMKGICDKIMGINEKIKELRNESGYTQKEISEKLNITERQYINIESGKSKPSLDTIIKIANIYNISIDYIVERTNYRGLR